MSNFDHAIDRSVEQKLRGGFVQTAAYAAWNFYGVVYFNGNEFFCDIWIQHGYVETLIGTLEEIMDYASRTWGYD